MDNLRKSIETALHGIDLYTHGAFKLLLGTAAQESCYGKYRKQIGGGPALGVFQMEPATHDDCWVNFLNYRPELAAKILKVSGLEKPDYKQLENNDIYAACMCRVKYLRDKKQMPNGLDIVEMGNYWKRVYNTNQGKGRVYDFVQNYMKYVAPNNI